MHRGARLALIVIPLALAFAAGASSCGQKPAYQWDLPQGFPAPAQPASNPMSDEKVELGRFLFYDHKLSDNQTNACATCHVHANAIKDGRPQAIGSTGMMTRHGAMGLTNVGYLATHTWMNPTITTLEDQARLPMIGEMTTELALAGKEEELLDRLRGDAQYPAMFHAAFPDAADPLASGGVGIQDVLNAIGAFVRTLISGNSPYDRFQHGDATAMSDAAQRGMMD